MATAPVPGLNPSFMFATDDCQLGSYGYFTVLCNNLNIQHFVSPKPHASFYPSITIFQLSMISGQPYPCYKINFVYINTTKMLQITNQSTAFVLLALSTL